MKSNNYGQVPHMSSCGLSRLRPLGRNDHRKDSALPRLRTYFNDSTMVFYDPLADGQTQPRAAVFGGEEGNKDIRSHFRCNSSTIVNEADLHKALGVSFGLTGLCFDPQLTTCFGRLDPIETQVQKDLMELFGVRPDLG